MEQAKDEDKLDDVILETTDELDALFEELYRQSQTVDKFSDDLCSKLEKLSETERQQLVSRDKNGLTPLYLSAKEGFLDNVNYLLDKCKADVNQNNFYYKNTDEPLVVQALMAARTVDIARCLLEHDAREISFALLSHVFLKHFKVADYLDSRGAVFDKAMFAKCGISVNVQTELKETPLHIAIQVHRLKWVEQLLNSGADPMIEDCNGNDALQLSCCLGHEDIFNYLMEHVEYSAKTRANAHELIGVFYLTVRDPKYNPKILEHWKEALRIRQNDGGQFLERDPIDIPPFVDVREFRTEDELDMMVTSMQSMLIQAVFISRRILGANFEVTFSVQTNLLNNFTNNYQFKECIQHLMYNLEATVSVDGQQSAVTREAVTDMVFKFLNTAEIIGFDHECIQFDDATFMARVLLAQLEDKNDDNFTLYLLTITLNLFFRMPKNECQQQIFLNMIKNVVQKRFCHYIGHSILHIIACKIPSTYIKYQYRYFQRPLVSFVRLLLECGHSVDTLDSYGSSPLLYALLNGCDLGFVDCFLENGAHIDRINANGIRPCHLLDAVHGFKYVTLKCLAARTIADHGVPYKHLNFPALDAFIEIH